MTRLDRIIKAFNDYDNFVKKNTIAGLLEREDCISESPEREELNNIRNEVSILIGELKRHGCRRKD